MVEASPGDCRFLSSEAYRDAWRICVRHSHHPANTAKVVREQVLPHLAAATGDGGGLTCLDVGAGDGSTARLLTTLGFHVTTIDCNPEYYEQQEAADGGKVSGGYRLRRPEHCSCGRAVCTEREQQLGDEERINVVVADFLATDLGGKQFDLVLGSHVLYQMPDAVMQAFLFKMMECTRPGGFLLLAYCAPRGPIFELTQALNPQIVFSPHIVQLVNRMGMACDVFPAAAPLELDTLEEVEAVLKFVAFEDCNLPGAPAPDAATIDAAVQRLLPGSATKDSRGYIIPDEHDYILVHKAMDSAVACG